MQFPWRYDIILTAFKITAAQPFFLRLNRFLEKQLAVIVLISGEGVDSFWRVLLEAKNCAVEIPAERFDTTFWCDAENKTPGKMQTTKAALIEG